MKLKLSLNVNSKRKERKDVKMLTNQIHPLRNILSGKYISAFF